MIRGACHRRDKRVAATWNVSDIAGSFAPVAERLSKASDMNAERAFFDVDVGPDALDQIALGHDLSGAIDQRTGEFEPGSPVRRAPCRPVYASPTPADRAERPGGERPNASDAARTSRDTSA